MNKIILLIGVGFCCLIMTELKAQDPFFSQFYNTGMTLNPAITAMQEKDIKVSTTFRSQWWGGGAKPYNATFAAFETKLRKDSTNADYFGLGIFAMTENSNGGLLKNQQLNFTGVYHNALDGNGRKYFSSAISLAFANRIIDPSLFITQSQFGSYGFNSNSASYEPINLSNNKYVDVNAGIGYRDRQPEYGYRLGLAIYHAFAPKQGMYETTTYRMDRRLVYEGEFYWGNENKNFWTLSANSQLQGPFSLYTIGAIYSTFVPQEDWRLSIGFFDRIDDALYPYISIQSDSWKLGASYDIVTNKLRTSYNSIQSAEISLAWTFDRKK